MLPVFGVCAGTRGQFINIDWASSQAVVPLGAAHHQSSVVSPVGAPKQLVVAEKFKSKTVSKIVQIQQQYGMLVKIGDQLGTVIGRSLTPIACIESNKAHVMKELLIRVSSASHFSSKFRNKSRFACKGKTVLTCRSIGPSGTPQHRRH